MEALEQADRADFDDESVGHLLNVVDQEIRSRGFSYYFTRDAALAHALIRAEAYNRHRQLGNYGRAIFHAALGVIDSFGYVLYGDSAGETARNFAISMVVGAALTRLSAASRAAQQRVQASSEALTSRITSRRATPSTSPEAPSPTTVQTPHTPQARTPQTRSETTTPPQGVPTAPRLVNRSVPGERYFVQDTTHSRFSAVGTISPRKELSISIRK